jgi:hypothetical protein
MVFWRSDNPSEHPDFQENKKGGKISKRPARVGHYFPKIYNSGFEQIQLQISLKEVTTILSLLVNHIFISLALFNRSIPGTRGLAKPAARIQPPRERRR